MTESMTTALEENDMWQMISGLCPKHVADNVSQAIWHPNGGTATSAIDITDAFKCHYEQLGSHATFSAANTGFDDSFQHAVHCDVLSYAPP